MKWDKLFESIGERIIITTYLSYPPLFVDVIQMSKLPLNTNIQCL